MQRQLDDPDTQPSRQPLPGGVIDLPPGAELAAQLADVDLRRLNGHDLIALAPAYVKMISHFQTQLSELVHQVQHSPPGDAGSPAIRDEQPNPWAHVDLAARLRWSASKADAELLADGLLRAGATGWTSRQISDRLRRAVLALDPIARTAKQQGDRRTVNQLRADIICDLIAGTGIGATPAGPVTNPGPTGLRHRPMTDADLSDEDSQPPEQAAGSPATLPGPLPGPRRGVVHVYASADNQRDGFSATDVSFIKARDRTCRGPQACPVPASATDTDHTIAKVDGGTHTIDSGGPLCEREHLYKHHSGAKLQQIQPGVFVWITQFGHIHTVRPETPDDTVGPPPRTATHRVRRILQPAQAP